MKYKKFGNNQKIAIKIFRIKFGCKIFFLFSNEIWILNYDDALNFLCFNENNRHQLLFILTCMHCTT